MTENITSINKFLKNQYCNNLISRSRLLTREVKIGEIGIGGNNPIRVQSMTTTDTMDTEKTVAQSIRMIEAGCELVRITAPSINEAKNLGIPILTVNEFKEKYNTQPLGNVESNTNQPLGKVEPNTNL